MNDRRGPLRRIDQTGVPLLLARLILGGLFVWMGSVKAADPAGFLQIINEYELVPQSASLLLNLLAVVVPWLEVFGGALLITGSALRGTSVMFLVMLVAFSAAVLSRAIDEYQAQAIGFCDVKFDCGCGAGEIYICHKLLENAGLTLLSIVVLLSRSRRFCLRADLFGGPGAVPTSGAK